MTDLNALIASERRSLADILDTLSDEQSKVASGCLGWTVRNVAAHLAMPLEMGLPKMAFKIIAAKGDFNAMANKHALAEQRSLSALAVVIRDNAENRFKPPGFGFEAPLADIVIHGQDICRPLGINRAVPSNATIAILNLCVSPKATRGFVKKGLVDGLQFDANDVEWTHGSGATVAGPSIAIALTLSGRAVGLDELSGDGVEILRSRM